MRPNPGQAVERSGKDLESADRAVVMLHGRGASAAGMLRLSENLPEAAFLAPQADNRSWYPHRFMEPVERNQPHLDSALEVIEELVEECVEAVGRDNVYILGFSQGACLASEFAARNPGLYGGIFILSGGLIGESLNEYSGDMSDTHVFIGCAENDPHIPVERVNETASVFEELNASVEKHVFEGSHHGVTEYEIERINELIAN